MSRKKIYFINLLPIILISINLRGPITSVGPIANLLQDYYELSSAQVGLLTSLPLLAFGVVSFLVAVFQPIRAMFFGLVCIILGEVLRCVGDSITLFVGTAIMGSGIAIANVLLPSFVKVKFPREIPKVMGIYGLVLNISAALGMIAILPLAHILPLPLAFGCWVILAILAFVSYLPQIKNRRIFRPKRSYAVAGSLFANMHAWKITLFMGLQSAMAYSFFAWYPSLLIDFGFDKSFISRIMILMQCIIVPLSFIIPLWLHSLRQRLRDVAIVVICMLYAINYSLLLISHEMWLVILASIFIGVPIGGVFSVALLFISSKSANASVATKLSAMSQGIGYLMASICPWIIGKIHDAYHSFTYAIFMLIILSLLLNVVGYYAQRVVVIE
ncbi:CynX/NimT family MFS transporter [Helicobacter trogontum]|uniref:CynX/NimT family MFS transporter n=1 Tax=Helicobacter trogontum TaxID=50960 RepID=A0ABQ0D329_9HELI